ncbi:hypothetical protein PFLUV_G00079630 [Perca fluviatilis]|uniref:Uncharacterized protein n=1 Tax=Perca fluviatilis TaxID=8168 RepID=A0A6A5FGG1_PERFL|nr:hypothetical protein PFLUV_G00079630 [Perca fluviatilis]
MSRAARPESPAARCPGRRQEQPHSRAAVEEHRVGSGTRDSGAGSARSKRHLEGVLKKYTNPLQGWQSRSICSYPGYMCFTDGYKSSILLEIL